MVDYRNILIVKLSAIGDVIHALPVAQALKQQYPLSKITWIVEKPAYDLLTLNPNIDEIIVFDKPKYKSLAGLFDHGPELARMLKAYKFDLAIDLQGLFKSAALAWLSGAPTRVGYCNMRELSNLVSKPICGRNQKGHVVDRYLDVARGLGCDVQTAEWVINPSGEDVAAVTALLDDSGLKEGAYIVIAPGTNWPSKCWFLDRYAQLADQLHEEFGLRAVIVGGPKDQTLAAEINANGKYPVYDFTGKTSLKQLAFLLKQSKLFVGGDTGPMHLAVAMNTPVVTLFGPSDPARNGPYRGKSAVITAEEKCAPCFKRKCEDTGCMKNISVQQVFQACKEILT